MSDTQLLASDVRLLSPGSPISPRPEAVERRTSDVSAAPASARASARSSAVVIFMLRGLPSTSRTRCPACSARNASSVACTCDWPRRMASASTPRRNACGVWARKIASRGNVRSIQARSSSVARSQCATLTVSWACSAQTAAPASAAPSIARSIRSASTNGRAASCTTMMSARSSTAANPLATESWRRAPPTTTVSGLAEFGRKSASISRSGGSTTTTASMRGWRRNTSMLIASMGRPAMGSSCLGTPAPTRSPRPPAAMMAAITTCY